MHIIIIPTIVMLFRNSSCAHIRCCVFENLISITCNVSPEVIIDTIDIRHIIITVTTIIIYRVLVTIVKTIGINEKISDLFLTLLLLLTRTMMMIVTSVNDVSRDGDSDGDDNTHSH